MTKHSTAEEYRRRIMKAQRLIEEQLDASLTPAELAEAAHFSLHHFHRIFRAQTGETVMQYVRRLRIERAARKLRASPQTRVMELALEAGYESHEAFTRAFIDRFGAPPSHYREQESARLAAFRASGPLLRQVEVTVADYPQYRVAFMRHRGSYAKVGETWQKMLAWAAPRGALELYGLCPDDPDVTAEELLRFDACAVVNADIELGSDRVVELGWIDAGTYAVGVHVGPYELLHETYLDVIGRWFPSSGYELAAAPVVEHYLNDPSCTPKSELRTEVRVRIAD